MMLPVFFGSAFLAVSFVCKEAAAMHSSYLTDQDVIDFLRDGHILLHDVLPELREESFREEYEFAKKESTKAHERWFLEYMDCDKPGMKFLERMEAGEGTQVLKDCADFKHKSQRKTEEDVRDNAPFNQIINLHEHSRKIRDVAMKFGAIAADLFQIERVRLYQSRTFRKVPSKDETLTKLFNHFTSMHADLTMVPLDTNHYLTFWCPTRNLTAEDSVLTYATGSHRDIAKLTWYDQGYWEYEYEEDDEEEVEINPSTGPKDYQADEEASETESESTRIQRENVEVNAEDSERYDIILYDDIRVGDCVVHHGWTLHGATSQVFKNGPRDALTFSYIDGDARKLASGEDRNADEFMDEEFKKDEIMIKDWYYDIAPGAVVDHPKLLLVWPPSEDSDRNILSNETVMTE